MKCTHRSYSPEEQNMLKHSGFLLLSKAHHQFQFEGKVIQIVFEIQIFYLGYSDICKSKESTTVCLIVTNNIIYNDDQHERFQELLKTDFHPTFKSTN